MRLRRPVLLSKREKNGSDRVKPGWSGYPGSTRVERVILGPLGHPEPVGSSHANPGSFSVVHLTPGRGPPGHDPPPGFQPDQPATRVNPEKTPGPTHFFPRLAKLDVPVRRVVVRLSMFANTCIMQCACGSFDSPRALAPRGICVTDVCSCLRLYECLEHSPLYAPILSVRFPALRLVHRCTVHPIVRPLPSHAPGA